MNAARKPKVRREISELSLLWEISQELDRTPDLRDVVGPVLKLIARHMGMRRGTVVLHNRERREIMIEAAHGLSKSQRVRGRYKMGEGITGRVVESGQPMVVPKISEEPEFLNRTGARRKLRKQDISFICVPIKQGRQVFGALSVDRLFEESVTLEEDVRMLSIIASLIAQAVSLRQSMAEERQRLLEENQRLQAELKTRFQPANIIGHAKAIQTVYDQIAQVSGSTTNVLIRGESGTGKELVAQALHYNSPRSSKPFVKVNCAAMPESLVESELFGHERGAFTGAVTQRKGRFEQAQGGTIFLDEVGDFSAATQIKVLRVLQEREFERVGGTRTMAVDVRIIAATNRNLENMIETGEFRDDLYYRLNVFPIHVPPLRERKNDILLLADHFIEKYSRVNNKDVRRISTPAIDMLTAYHWPGNVRELENCIERAVLLSKDDVIHGHHLPPSLQTAEATGTGFSGSLQEQLENMERELILDALKSARGNMAKAARQLGLTERVMGLRVKKHGIDYRRFRTSK